MDEDEGKLVKYESEIRPIVGGEILHASAEQLDTDEAVEAYVIIKYIGERIDDRKKELRKRIISDESIALRGKRTPKGYKARVNGNKVSLVRQDKMYAKKDRLKEILAEKGIDESEVFITKTEVVETVTEELDPSRIERLIELGHLTPEELQECHTHTDRLTIAPSEALEELFEVASSRQDRQKMLYSSSK